MEREGWEAGIGTDVEAPVGGMYEGCSECRPLWPIYVGKKKKCPVAADAEVSNLKQLQGVGVEQLYSTLDSLGTYTR